MPVAIRTRLRRQLVRLAAFKALAQKVLRVVGEADAELGIELVGDQRMRQLNRMYRGHDAPTDVLAFPMREALTPVTRLGSTFDVRCSGSGNLEPRTRRCLTPDLLGDVVISLHTAARQAQAQGHSLNREIVMLLVHGLVHLCGYDHERGEREARRMRRREAAVLRSLLPIPKLVDATRHE